MASNKHSENSGPSQRQLKVGELIRRTLAEALGRGDIHDPDLNRMMITVSEASVTADLKIATIYVMPLGGKDHEEAIALMVKNKGEMRRIIGRKAQLKYTPELRFRIDETFDRMDDTRRLFGSAEVRRDLED